MSALVMQTFRELALPTEANRVLGAQYLVRDQATGEVVSHYVSPTDKSVVSRTISRQDVLNLITTAGAGKLKDALTISTAAGADVSLNVTFDGSEGNVTATAALKDRLGLGAGTVTYASTTFNSQGVAVGGSVTLAESQLPSQISGAKINGDISGNAGSATKLATKRTIAGHDFDGTQNVEITAADVGAVATTAIGQTVAPLVNGLVPSENLPTYVDDVIEVDQFDKLPGRPNAAAGTPAPERGKLYVVLDDPEATGNPVTKVYRWSGSVYVQILDGVSLADQAYALYQSQKIEIGGEGSDATWSVMFKGDAPVVSPLTLANTTVTAGDYGFFRVDSKGRMTFARKLELADVPKGLTYEWVDSAKSVVVENAAW